MTDADFTINDKMKRLDFFDYQLTFKKMNNKMAYKNHLRTDQ